MNANAHPRLQVKTRVNDSGRIVVPAEMRKELGIAAGDTVFLSMEGDHIRIESQLARLRRVQKSLRTYIPAGVSLVDELIAERREEAHREMEEG